MNVQLASPTGPVAPNTSSQLSKTHLTYWVPSSTTRVFLNVLSSKRFIWSTPIVWSGEWAWPHAVAGMDAGCSAGGVGAGTGPGIGIGGAPGIIGGICGCMNGIGIMTFIRCCSLMNALFNWFSIIFTAGVALNVWVKA